MTATVSMIVGEAKSVLRVPNAALRFTPANMSQEQLAAARKEAMDKMIAERQAQGGQAGQPGAPAGGSTPGGARPQGQAGQEGQRTFNRQGGQGGGQFGGGQAGGEGQRTRPQIPIVWLMGQDGKMTAAIVRTGVSDTSYTEIVRGDIKEGDIVVTGTLTASTITQQGGPGMGGMMFMGGPPGGGRR